MLADVEQHRCGVPSPAPPDGVEGVRAAIRLPGHGLVLRVCRFRPRSGHVVSCGARTHTLDTQTEIIITIADGPRRK